ncbi:DUF4242 domain-containing protein [Nocardia sp. BMG51109]|uniref:DUF4242 domain-containing protein n=1 Tax=Nocardia sp. BMG51109 TaxID=1056816 RepID=UPI0004654065|nr:DUF4242 domain-containing protein [Nocardia sp. BMG51109]
MSLYLFEVVPSTADRTGARQVLEQIAKAAAAAGVDLIEAQVTADHGRVFAVVEATAETAARPVLDGLSAAGRDVSGPDEVRLVGADPDELKAARPHAGYLVEWDLPEDLDMETYLARKQAKAPRYADVPEVSFLRTYVREDMDKCLCFYDGPDEGAVRSARRAVDTPVDRLHALEDPECGG